MITVIEYWYRILYSTASCNIIWMVCSTWYLERPSSLCAGAGQGRVATSSLSWALIPLWPRLSSRSSQRIASRADLHNTGIGNTDDEFYNQCTAVLRIRIRDPELFYPPDPGWSNGRTRIRDKTSRIRNNGHVSGKMSSRILCTIKEKAWKNVKTAPRLGACLMS
jgi:hypothetical protein